MGISIQTEALGKQYINDWVFRDLTHTFSQGERHAIIGHNGSGKSTLCNLLTGMVPPSEGTIEFADGKLPIDPDTWHTYLSFAAPYQELIEEFTLQEFLLFHSKFRPWREGISNKVFLEMTGLEKSAGKPIAQFSSGMKQRVRLGLAFFGNAKVLILDEPTSNLDSEGKAWYAQHIADLPKDALLIISSNDEEEYRQCGQVLDITGYK